MPHTGTLIAEANRLLEVDLQFPTEAPDERIEYYAQRRGLILKPMGKLKSFPGCSHWHLSRASERGTLELTYWPKQCRFWIKVASGRGAEWIDTEIELLKTEFGGAVENCV